VTNASFTSFRNGIMTGLVDLDTAVFKVAVVAGYTFNAAHVFLSEVIAASGIVNGTAATLTTPTVVAGVFDADDVTITTVSSANPHSLIVYQASAVTGGADVASSAQRLCWFFDTGGNLPIVPGAGTLTITWPNTSGKIYKVG
jgi:hypothetical protein